MNFKQRFALLVYILFQIQIFAFPISIRDNWFVKEGKDLQYQKDPSSWQNFKELSVKSTEVKNLSDSKVLVLSFFKEVSISEEDYNKLSESVSIWLPYLANGYEIFFNGKKIAEEGSFDSEKVIRHGFHRHLITKIPTPLIKKGTNEIYIIVKGVRGEIGRASCRERV